MIVLTCVSDSNHPGYDLLIKSCAYYGLNLKTLFHQKGWVSHRLKDFYVKKYLETLMPDEIVLFTDGYDTMFVTGEKQILDKYYAATKPVVFSAEINCYPHEAYKTDYGIGKTKFQYLNSGGYIGKVSDLLKLYSKLEKMFSGSDQVGSGHYHKSNQFLWTKLFLVNRMDICLDYDCSIFQTFVNRLDFPVTSELEMEHLLVNEANRVLEDFYIEHNKLFNEVTNSTPCHLHFNGMLFKNIVKSGVLNDIIPWKK